MKKFGNHIENLQSHKMPGMPKFLTVRPLIKSEKISMEDQKEYWSGVGMLLFLVKHSRPDIVNMTRELSKASDGANLVAFKDLLYVIIYILDKKNFSLKLKPTGNTNKPLQIICFSNSDYAGDLISKRSISDFILYVLDVLVCWWSEVQKCVTLSISEAVWVDLSEAVKGVTFVIQLLGCMKISVKLSVMVRVDNVGAVFMASKSCTRHVYQIQEIE